MLTQDELAEALASESKRAELVMRLRNSGAKSLLSQLEISAEITLAKRHEALLRLLPATGAVISSNEDLHAALHAYLSEPLDPSGTDTRLAEVDGLRGYLGRVLSSEKLSRVLALLDMERHAVELTYSLDAAAAASADDGRVAPEPLTGRVFRSPAARVLRYECDVLAYRSNPQLIGSSETDRPVGVGLVRRRGRPPIRLMRLTAPVMRVVEIADGRSVEEVFDVHADEFGRPFRIRAALVAAYEARLLDLQP